MNTKRSANSKYFECRDCGNRINPVSYRATCPNCGGPLRSIPTVVGGA